MSSILELGTKPQGLRIKTWGFEGPLGDTVFLGDYEISMADFLCAASYVLTNTALTPDDPRRQFVKCVQSMTEVDGYGGSPSKRLKYSEPPISI